MKFIKRLDATVSDVRFVTLLVLTLKEELIIKNQPLLIHLKLEYKTPDKIIECLFLNKTDQTMMKMKSLTNTE